jgi:DNA-binding response OmpR family regulator
MTKRILILDEGQEPPSCGWGEFNYKQFRILLTSDGKNLIQIAKKFNPDLFILDFSMAGHTPEDICRQIQWRREFKHVPTILSTAYLYDAIDYEALGCDDILFKPYDLDEVIEKATGLVMQ